MIELESGYTLINKGWRYDHGKGEKLRLYFSKGKDGKVCISLDAVVTDELLTPSTSHKVPCYVRVFWDELNKIMMIRLGDPIKEDVLEFEPVICTGTTRQWQDEDVEALLKEKAPIGESEIGYCVNGTWDSERQCLIYDLNKRKPIKEGVIA